MIPWKQKYEDTHFLGRKFEDTHDSVRVMRTPMIRGLNMEKFQDTHFSGDENDSGVRLSVTTISTALSGNCCPA